jgi:hypothetical protein
MMNTRSLFTTMTVPLKDDDWNDCAVEVRTNHGATRALPSRLTYDVQQTIRVLTTRTGQVLWTGTTIVSNCSTT